MILDPNNPIPGELLLAQEMIELVANGRFVCAAISGPPGMGKTRLVELAEARTGIPFKWIKGASSPAALLQTAWEMRSGGVIVLDDADRLIVGGGINGANVAKQLLLPERERVLHNKIKKAYDNARLARPLPHIPAPEFICKASVIWLTNMDLEGVEMTPKMAQHVQPLIDRGLQPIRLSSNPEHLLNYVLHLVCDQRIRIPKGKPLSVKATNEVLEYFVTHAWQLPSISVRTIEMIAAFRAETPKWREHMNARLQPAIITAKLPPIPVLTERQSAVDQPEKKAA